MITLYTSGPFWGLPDASPFVTKAEVLLKMANISYKRETGDATLAPQKRMPYIDDNGTIVPDSTFIRLHLENKYMIDFDKGLSASDRATAWAFEKFCEDHILWLLTETQWMVSENFDAGIAELFAAVPGWKRSSAKRRAYKQMKADLWAQGTGRLSKGEIARLAERDLNMLSSFLGNKQFLMGGTPCGADAGVFAILLSALNPNFKTPVRLFAESHANLRSYTGRMLRRYFPDQAQAVESIPAPLLKAEANLDL